MAAVGQSDQQSVKPNVDPDERGRRYQFHSGPIIAQDSRSYSRGASRRRLAPIAVDYQSDQKPVWNSSRESHPKALILHNWDSPEEKLREEVASLQLELDKATEAAANVKSLQIKITRLEVERENLRKRVIAMESYYKIEGVEFGDVEKMELSKQQLSASQSQVSTLKEQLQKAVDKISAAESEIRRMVTEISILKEDVINVWTANAELKERNLKAHEELIDLISENKEMKAVHAGRIAELQRQHELEVRDFVNRDKMQREKHTEAMETIRNLQKRLRNATDSQVKMMNDDVRASKEARNHIHRMISQISQHAENEVQRTEARKTTVEAEIAQQKDSISKVGGKG
jgi:hypothetical protein